MRKYLLAAAAVLLLAGCGVAKPWVAVDTNAEGHAVLMVGDSLLGQTDATMVESLAKYGFTGTKIIDAHVNGSGLIGRVPFTAADGTVTWYDDATAWMLHNLELYPEVDTVVIEYGGACAICGMWIKGVPVYGEGDFYEQWRASALKMIDAARAAGKHVLYTISPIAGASGNGTVAHGSQYTMEVARWLSLWDRMFMCPAADACVDWWDPLVDTNDNYQQTLWFDDAWRKVRSDDHVHLEYDGSIRTSTWTVSSLGAFWNANPAPLARGLAPIDGPALVEAGDPVRLGTQ